MRTESSHLIKTEEERSYRASKEGKEPKEEIHGGK